VAEEYRDTRNSVRAPEGVPATIKP
jgi:hypothetical protein